MIYLAVFIDLLITFGLVLSLFTIHKNRKQINEYKFRIYSRFTVVISIIIVLALINFCEAIFSYFTSGRISPLLNAYVNIVIIVLFYSYALCKSYICDSGLWAWGNLRKWNEIQSYYWVGDRRYIVFQIKDKSIISEYKLRYRIDQERKEEINAYLNNHLVKLKSIQNA